MPNLMYYLNQMGRCYRGSPFGYLFLSIDRCRSKSLMKLNHHREVEQSLKAIRLFSQLIYRLHHKDLLMRNHYSLSRVHPLSALMGCYNPRSLPQWFQAKQVFYLVLSLRDTFQASLHGFLQEYPHLVLLLLAVQPLSSAIVTNDQSLQLSHLLQQNRWLVNE